MQLKCKPRAHAASLYTECPTPLPPKKENSRYRIINKSSLIVLKRVINIRFVYQSKLSNKHYNRSIITRL